MRRARGSGALLLAPVVVALAFLAAWEALVRVGRVAPFVLPSPTAVLASLREVGAQVLAAAGATGLNALVGLVAGTALALLAASLAARVRVLREALVPLAAAAAAIPIVALAPVFATMYGATSELPRRLVVTLVVFVPVFVNALRGLLTVDPVHAELMRSYAASGWATTRWVRLPGALPFVFTGLRLAASAAVISAVVAEYFGGLQTGLGSRITSAAANSAYPRAWAYVVAACALGLLFYAAALALERAATPWRRAGTG
ncbi:MAG: ABC transporter, permease protein (cluster 10, nitrate/sulfonate/bicarbonate) [uncultured Quadrisphaera sp.]|uniref:ABC transporter, permease protein (Cluster 10, nitrate/sulfonate/bicarbonate) n=1 Tax=uncultured Quadrisphaera sp. TaxID=904978 RepID=A0A6J4NJV5_9ACTN|nr:MAG: ABC transporter, permease protein (cluster 10, nitrate/sulfonate/bicarbonate) [uncultured Quadrisphaera sp.]